MIGLDTSFLLAAEGRHDHARWTAATAILARINADDLIVPGQALAEMLHILTREMGESADDAGVIVARWLAALGSADLSGPAYAAARGIARQHGLPLEDALIIAAAGAVGARYLLSDDFEDGLVAGGLTTINPFGAAGAARLERVLEKA